MDCLFCKIAEGEIPSEIIYEDDYTLAFLDINPINPGHTLVIPKKHFKNIADISYEAFASVMKTVKRLTPIIQKELGADGINVGINNGSAAGQMIFHSHVHIIPRSVGDGHSMWRGPKYKEGEIELAGKRLREAAT